jgi:hypothetical protein
MIIYFTYHLKVIPIEDNGVRTTDIAKYRDKVDKEIQNVLLQIKISSSTYMNCQELLKKEYKKLNKYWESNIYQ